MYSPTNKLQMSKRTKHCSKEIQKKRTEIVIAGIDISELLKQWKQGLLSIQEFFSNISNNIERLQSLDPLQYAWLLFHSTTLIGSIMYGISLLDNDAKIFSVPWYNMVIISSIMTYGIVIYTGAVYTERSHTNSAASFHEDIERNVPLCRILKSENTYLFIYACLWACTHQSIIKISSFGIYSFLNLMNHIIFELFPEHSFSVCLAPLAKYIEGPLLIMSAHLDLLAIILLAKEAYAQKSLYCLIFYLFIWGLRVEYSDASRIAISNILVLINSLLFNNLMPQFVQKYWTEIRTAIIELFSLDKSEITDTNMHYEISPVEGKASSKI